MGLQSTWCSSCNFTLQWAYAPVTDGYFYHQSMGMGMEKLGAS